MFGLVTLNVFQAIADAATDFYERATTAKQAVVSQSLDRAAPALGELGFVKELLIWNGHAVAPQAHVPGRLSLRACGRDDGGAGSYNRYTTTLPARERQAGAWKSSLCVEGALSVADHGTCAYENRPFRPL